MKNTVLFLSDHVGDPGLTCVEVVADLLHCVGFSALFHDRLSGYDTCCVFGSACKECRCFEIVLHVVRSQLHVAICDGDITIVVDHLLAVAEILDDRVAGSGECR